MNYSKKTGFFKEQNAGFSAQIHSVTLTKTWLFKKEMLYVKVVEILLLENWDTPAESGESSNYLLPKEDSSNYLLPKEDSSDYLLSKEEAVNQALVAAAQYGHQQVQTNNDQPLKIMFSTFRGK